MSSLKRNSGGTNPWLLQYSGMTCK